MSYTKKYNYRRELANQKLQHEMSSVHQTLNSDAKVLERYLKHYGIEHKELWETVNILKRTCEKSKSILKSFLLVTR